MHATLQIPELLELIFSHISEKKSLNALARTCAAFLEPALACLWARIVTLEPFILLLPECKRRKDKVTWITTVDELTEDDVARMRFYAPLVRDLDLRNSNSSFEIDGASVARVAHALCTSDARALGAHQACIFPNLRTCCLVAGYADFLPALLAPSITELDLILHYRSMVLEELHRTMRILLERMPPVKKLHVVLDYPDNQNHLFRELLAQRRDMISSRSGDGISSRLGDTASPHLSDTIQCLVIDFSHLDTATLQAIAALPNLEHLEVYGGYRAHEFGLEEDSDLAAASSTLESSSTSTFDSSRSSNHDSPSSSTLGSSPSLFSSSLPIITTFPAPSPPPRATRLKSLSIDILTEDVLSPYISGTVLRILDPPALARLTLERILSPEHMRRVCFDIGSSFAAQTLTHLTLSGDWSVTNISPSDLRALYACRHLVDLELVWISVRFDEKGIWEMGEAWPRLRRFAVRKMDRELEVGDTNEPHVNDASMESDEDRPPRTCSLGGLASFARYLPTVEELEISVDTSAVPGDTNSFDVSCFTSSFDSASRLRSLNVGTSHIDAPPAHIAAVLTRCFPQLTPEALVSVSKRWDIVRRLMHEGRRS